MKIMIVNTYYAPEIMGGAEYSVKKLAEKLKEDGHEVCVLCTGDSAVREIVDGISVVRIKSRCSCRAIHAQKYTIIHRGIRCAQDIWNPLNVKGIKKAMLDFVPDVVHTNGLYDFSPIVWKVAQDLRIRVVHTLRDYHLMCRASALTCKRAELSCNNPGMFCIIRRWLNRKSSRYVDYVTAPSRVTLGVLKENGFFPDTPSKVISNATDFDIEKIAALLEQRKQRSCTGKHSVNFVYLGNLSEQKGIRWMVESFRSLTDQESRLYIAGKGKMESYVKEVCLKDARIKFEGFLNENGVDTLLNSCDILLCPSLWEEPFGRVVLDAYKHAMPVIASDKGALPELVKDGVTGFVVSAGDAAKMKAAMQYYIDNFRSVCDHGTAGTERLKSFTLEYQVEEFLKIYKKEMEEV